MGLRGPQPKEGGERARLMKQPGLGWIDLPAEGRQGPVPHLHQCPFDSGEWSEESKSMWIRLWQSPQATQWDADNPDAIRRYITLHEEARIFGWRGPGLTAVAQIEDKHGLTPASMRRLYWRFADADNGTQLASVAPIKKREELR